MIENVTYPQSYTDDIQNKTFARMDSKENGGNNDGKISIDEAWADLNANSLFNGLQKDSDEYNKLKAYTDKIPEALIKYAGEDKEFSANEWAQFLNGDEWGNVIETYHSSSNFAKREMKWIDNQGIEDNKITKGEIKAGILNNMAQSGKKLDTTGIEALIDKYSGDDGIFSFDEYQSLKNDNIYKTFLDKNNISPLYSKGEEKTNTQKKDNKTGTFKSFFDKAFSYINNILNKS